MIGGGAAGRHSLRDSEIAAERGALVLPAKATALLKLGDQPVDQVLETGKKTEKSLEVGKRIAAKAKDAGITKVVFDRAGYKYHGRVKAVADGAREGGLEF